MKCVGYLEQPCGMTLPTGRPRCHFHQRSSELAIVALREPPREPPAIGCACGGIATAPEHGLSLLHLTYLRRTGIAQSAL